MYKNIVAPLTLKVQTSPPLQDLSLNAAKAELCETAYAAEAPMYTVMPFPKKGKPGFQKPKERKRGKIEKALVRKKNQIGSREEGQGPTETAFAEGPEFGAVPLFVTHVFWKTTCTFS